MAIKSIQVVLIHSADPAAPTQGGGVRYFLEVLGFLTGRSVPTTFLGVQLGEREIERGKFTFLPVLKKSDTWYKYIVALLFKAPRLRIPPRAVIHAMRLEFMLPFVLFHRRNPKVFTPGSPPLYYARLHWRRLYPLIAPVYRLVEFICLRNIDCIASIDSIAEIYLQRHPWARDKIRVMPVSAVDFSNFRPLDRKALRQQWGFGEQERVIVAAGRLARVKNWDLLIRAFPAVIQQVPDARLVIVGRGDERSRLQELAKELHLPEVTFTGEVRPGRMPEIMNCADVLAHCSLKDGCEGIPTVVLEALACGVPVVSTDLSDVWQVIDRPTVGRIVGCDEKELAQGIIEVLAMLGSDSEEVRANCLATVEARGVDARGAELMVVYQQAVARRARG